MAAWFSWRVGRLVRQMSRALTSPVTSSRFLFFVLFRFVAAGYRFEDWTSSAPRRSDITRFVGPADVVDVPA